MINQAIHFFFQSGAVDWKLVENIEKTVSKVAQIQRIESQANDAC